MARERTEVFAGSEYERLAADVLNRTSALVVLVDSAGRVMADNEAALHSVGLNSEDLLGKEPAVLMCAPKDAVAFLQVLRTVARTGEPRSHDHDLPESDGARRSIAWTTSVISSGPSVVACVGVDVSAARSAAEDLLVKAMTDDLTGLPNRAHLLQVLGHLKDSRASVLFCDLNGFKAVNDTFGHSVGDATLVEVARRLKRAVRVEDFVARMGGDEFVIVAPPDPSASPEGLTRRVLGAMRQPMLLGAGVVVVVGVSIGVAELSHGQEPAEVLDQADAKMYVAKSLRASEAGLRAS
jgi:diguanylate cyclase (GGDEF)-like protein/PAS domain S-box-containing protein